MLRIYQAGSAGKCKCLTQTLHIGTGFNYDPNVNAVYNVGDLDNYWTVTCVPSAFGSNPPYPAIVIDPHPAWDGPLANSQWIGPHPAAENNINGVYCYEFEFCMTDTAGACLDLEMLVDDDAVVKLNGTQIFATGPGPSFCSPPQNPCFFQLPAQVIHTCGQGHFQTLINTLRIEVTNRWGAASGLNISGSVTARGASLEEEWCCDSSGAIAGIKWEDVIPDCVMGATEPRLSGWTMQLSGPSGTQQTQTDNFGYYFFNDLTPPGTYTVTEVVPPGWEAACPPSGSQSVVVPPHGIVSDVNFGNWRKPCDPAPSGMVAWWPLDEQDGATIVEDIAVAGYHPGTPYPGPIGSGGGPWPATWWPPAGGGKVGGALYFYQQYSDRFVRVTDQPDIQFGTTDFSIDAWVFINQYSLNCFQPIVEKMLYDGTTPETGYRFYLGSGLSGDGLLSFTLAWAGSYATIQSPSPITAGSWQHVAATVDRDLVNGADVKMYVNGTVVNWVSFLLYSEIIANTEDLFIGGSILGDQIDYLDIAIDEVELFDTVLTQEQIFSIAQADSFGKCKAELSGMKFHDHNRNGVKDFGDGGLAYWTIFLDGYGPTPGVWDPGEEPYRITDATGNYSFTVPVPPNNYTICEVNQSGFTQTCPDPTPYYEQAVVEYQIVPGLDFGNYGCEPCSNNVVENWSFTPDFEPWEIAYGTPDIGPSSPAWCDLGAVSMWGNQVVGEAIYQILTPNFDDDWCYAIKCDVRWSPTLPRPYPVQFEFRASTGMLLGTECSSPDCERIGVSEPVTPANTWMLMPTIIWEPSSDDYSYLTVSATNQSSYPHGDSTSYGSIDRICIQKYKPGDVNGDGINVGDLVYLVNYLYRGGPPPLPLEAGDLNHDGIVNVGDIVFLINYLYRGGPVPAC